MQTDGDRLGPSKAGNPGSRWPRAFVVAAIVFVGIPRAVSLSKADSVREVLGWLVASFLFGWLIWRLFLQMRDGWDQGSRFWYSSAAGYGAAFAAGAALVVRDSYVGGFNARSIPYLAFALLFFATSVVAAKQAERRDGA